MTYKVAVWAPGAVGRYAIVEAIKHPDLQLVGVYAYSEDKVGQDAGTFVGLPPTGVTITSDKNDIFALDADVVIHCASKAYGHEENDADLVRLVESGKNVITTTSYTHLPTYDPALCGQIDAACKKAGKSFFGTGENPGIMLERLIMTLTGVCHQIDHVILDEYADCTSHPEAGMIMDVMSMGQPPEEVTLDRPMVQAVQKMYHQALHGAAAVMNIELEKIEPSIELAVLDHDIDITSGRIKKGTVAGQKLRWSGYWQGKPFLTIRQTWVTTRDIPGWDVKDLTGWEHDNYWRIQVLGLPSLRLDMDLWTPENTEPGMEDASAVHVFVAMTAVRAIGEVCNAAPGIVYAPVFAPFRPRQV